MGDYAKIFAELEPNIDNVDVVASSCAELSIAISLKRIADELCGDGTHHGLKDSLYDLLQRK